jgi:hypothetical protein
VRCEITSRLLDIYLARAGVANRHSRSTNTLSRHEPRPSMLILIVFPNSTPVNADL